MTHAANDADDRLPLRLLAARRGRTDSFADGIFAGPEAFGHYFVDYNSTGAVRDVLFGNQPASQKRNPHRLKVAGAGTTKIDLGPFAGRNVSSFNGEKRGDVVERALQRQARDETDRSDFGSGGKVPFELLQRRRAFAVAGNSRSAGRVASSTRSG